MVVGIVEGVSVSVNDGNSVDNSTESKATESVPSGVVYSVVDGVPSESKVALDVSTADTIKVVDGSRLERAGDDDGDVSSAVPMVEVVSDVLETAEASSGELVELIVVSVVIEEVDDISVRAVGLDVASAVVLLVEVVSVVVVLVEVDSAVVVVEAAIPVVGKLAGVDSVDVLVGLLS